jgi:hypothetical protein
VVLNGFRKSREEPEGRVPPQPEKPLFCIAADLGKSEANTAVFVSELRLQRAGVPYEERFWATDWPKGGDIYSARATQYLEERQKVAAHIVGRRLDRVPLYTSYKAVARGLIRLVRQYYFEHGSRDDYPGGPVPLILAFDEGGVGASVLDDLREIAPKMLEDIQKRTLHGPLELEVVPVTATFGFNVTRSGGFFHVPRNELITAGQRAMQDGRLHLPANLTHRDILVEELRNYRYKLTAAGNITMRPERQGEHDDELFALCLGCWTWDYFAPEYIEIGEREPILEDS